MISFKSKSDFLISLVAMCMTLALAYLIVPLMYSTFKIENNKCDITLEEMIENKNKG